MRLLLLLSAILSALTGVVGSRVVVAQPVAASASAGGQVSHAAAAEVAASFAPAPRVRTVAVRGMPLVTLAFRRAHPLYADRPRE